MNDKAWRCSTRNIKKESDCSANEAKEALQRSNLDYESTRDLRLLLRDLLPQVRHTKLVALVTTLCDDSWPSGLLSVL